MTSGSVMLVDHDQLFSAALAALLEEEGMQVESPLPSLSIAEQALAQAPLAPPALIIADPSGLDRSDDADPLQRLRNAAPDARLLVLSADLSQASLNRSLAAGAHGHVSKAASFNAVLRAVRLILLGQAVYPAAATQGLGQAPAPMATATETNGEGGGADLSPRETQILACVISGHSNKAIARRLSITESTVKMHFKNAMRKINAGNRTQAAIWAMEHGIAPMA
ncbi:response regulator transcription factor [Niveispirillum sp.]|uniref:LuxR C-terminal-related transcriptional regulator n=1 Tax=Niveispirillum sp. TaxID=1917217 RepID=UPI001B747810|nr:response regulator transcription factor [Niveispirillum sp.]MBP7337054.1 response regulator transcription factor [Niveispirillum sp.]